VVNFIFFRIEIIIILSIFSVVDLIHVLSSVPRDLNFIDHTSDIGSKKYGSSEPVKNIIHQWH
jgi:hypothetical protein